MNKNFNQLIISQLIFFSGMFLLPLNNLFKGIFFFIAILIFNLLMIKKNKIEIINKLKKKELESTIDMLLNNNTSCYFTVDTNNRIIEKRCSKDLQELSFICHNNSITNTEVLRYVRKCFNTKEKIETTISIKMNNYSSKYFSLIVDYVCNKEQKYVVVILFDITNQKNIFKFLKESENKFSYFADIIPDAIVEHDERGNVLFLNKSAEDTFGYSKNSLGNIMNVVPEEDRYKVVDRIKNLMIKSEKNISATTIPEEYRLININDEIVYCKIISSIRVNEFGVKSIISVVSDINEYKIQQNTLEKKLEFEKLISAISKRFLTQYNRIETTQQAFIELSDFLNIDSIIVFLNDNEINRTTIEHSFLNKLNPKINSKKEQDLFLKNLYNLTKNDKSTFSSKKIYNKNFYNYFYEHLDSKYIISYKLDNNEYSLIFVFYFFNRENTPSALDMSAIEIFSELLSSLIFKNLLNKKIIEKQNSFDTLINDSSLGVISITDNKITFINDSAAKILNFNKEDCINKNASNVLNIYEIFNNTDLDYTKNKRYMKVYGEIEEKNVVIELKPVSVDEKNSTLITILHHEAYI